MFFGSAETDLDKLLVFAKTFAGSYKQVYVSNDKYSFQSERHEADICHSFFAVIDIKSKVRLILFQLLVQGAVSTDETVMFVWKGTEGCGIEFINVFECLGVLGTCFYEIEGPYATTLSYLINCALFVSKKRMGGFFVLGESEDIFKFSSPIQFDPFSGGSVLSIYSKEAFNVVAKYARLEYAFFVDWEGHIRNLLNSISVESNTATNEVDGLGSRHLTAKRLSSETNLITVTIQESNGSVRIYYRGKEAIKFDILAR